MSEGEKELTLQTVPPDPRYPNQNSTAWCFDAYVDFQKCSRLLGDENKLCDEFKKLFQTICPNAWIKRWDQQIKDGTFPLELPCKPDCGP
ncbi:unnamed protein product [Phyllotreta striolata]|uniref:Cytochrome c oxidase subunit n=1 Tax=Phyllotreta striolata TaxID=444603 RepID=A0A9N9TRM5_PHYSR|nr:unnamed protein product [Phyllotreta striolata]